MHHHIPSEVPVRYLPRDKTMNTVAGAMFVVGLLAFVFRLNQDSNSAWISYVTNWMFFSSIAMGSVMFAVATWIVKAKWNWSVRRVSQSGAAFLPIAFLLLLPMFTLGAFLMSRWACCLQPSPEQLTLIATLNAITS